MPESRRRQPKPDKRRGTARRKHEARPREQGSGPKPPAGQDALASQPAEELPGVMGPTTSRGEPTDVPDDESAGLALVDQTFTPDEGEQAREQAEEEREGSEQEGA